MIFEERQIEKNNFSSRATLLFGFIILVLIAISTNIIKPKSNVALDEKLFFSICLSSKIIIYDMGVFYELCLLCKFAPLKIF